MSLKKNMKQIISFLQQLHQNNNREWFNAHKAEFLEHQSRFHQLVEEVIVEIGKYDPTITGLTAKDCTYRIYRDVRFSPDKSPYKCHFGAFITQGGKKSGYSGYYFHIGTGLSNEYPHCHLLAAGDYCCSPEILKIIREDIVDGEGDFDQIVKQAAPTFLIDKENSLQRNPKGFAPDAPYSEYLRLKSYCLCHQPDNAFWETKHLAQHIAKIFEPTKDFLNYINRAIDFSREK